MYPSLKETRAHEKGRTWPPPPHPQDLPASAGDTSDDLVKGRVRHLIGMHLRRALNHVRQGFQHRRIGAAVVGFRVFFVGPHTNAHRFRAAWDAERNLGFEPWLFP